MTPSANPYEGWTSVPAEDVENLRPKAPEQLDAPADFEGWQEVSVEEVEQENDAFIANLFAETLPPMSLSEAERRGVIGRLAKELDLSEAFVERNFEHLQRTWEAAKFDPAKWRQENPELEEIILRRPPLAPVVMQDEKVGAIKRWWRTAFNMRRLRGLRTRELYEGVKFQVTRQGEDPSDLTVEAVPAPEPETRGPYFWLRWAGQEAFRETSPPILIPSDEEVVETFREEMRRTGALPPEQVPVVEDERALEGRALSGLGRLKAIWMTYEDYRKQAEANDIAAAWAIAKLRGQEERALQNEIQLERMEPELLPRDYGQGDFEQNFHDAAMLAASQVETFKGMGAGGLLAYVAAAGPVLAATKNKQAAHMAGMRAAGLGAKAGAVTFAFNQELGAAVRDYRTLRTDDGQLLDDEVVIGAALIYAGVASWIEQWSFLEDLRVLGPVGEAFARGGGRAYVANLTKDAGFRAIAKKLARAWVDRARTESLEEMTQEAFQMLTGYAARSVQAGELQEAQVVDAIGDILETGQTTFVGSLITGAATSAATAPINIAALRAVHRFEQSQEAAERSAAAVALVDKISETDLAKADPDAAAELVASETEKTGETVTELYLDPDAALRVFQEEGLDAQEAAALIAGPEGLQLFQEAQATGGKVAIPVSVYMERIAGTPLAKRLLPHLTTRPGRRTAAQIQQEWEEIEKAARELASKIEAEETPAESEAESQFIATLEKQLRETEVYSPEQVKKVVALWRAFARVISQRTGLSQDALFDRYRLHVELEGKAERAGAPTADAERAAPEPQPAEAMSAPEPTREAAPAAPEGRVIPPGAERATEALIEPAISTVPPEPTPTAPPTAPDLEPAPGRSVVEKSDDGAVVTYRPPPLPQRAAQDHSPALSEALARVEAEIRNKPVEHAVLLAPDGREVFRKTSNEQSQVSFSGLEIQELRKHEDLVFTHNHPASGPISPWDIVSAMLMNAAELRAVGADGSVWRIRRPPEGWPLKPPIDRFTRLTDEERSAFSEWLHEARRPWERAIAEATKAARERYAPIVEEKGYVDDSEWQEIWKEEVLEAYNRTAEELGYGWRVEWWVGSGEGSLRPVGSPDPAASEAAGQAAQEVGRRFDQPAFHGTARRYEQAQREAADPTQSPEFKRWFGDSKVVDSEGRPLVMYHGTAKEFDAFDPAARGSNTGARGAERAFFFARSPADASFYMEMSERQVREDWENRRAEAEMAGEPFDEPPPSGRIIPVYLKAENPLVLGFDDEESSVRGELLEQLVDDDVAALDYAREHGYDAVIWPYGNITNSGYTVAVFEPEQIKSTENVGAFDPADPNIFRQSAGPRGFMERRGDAFRIVLTEKADLSTFLHETAHVWLEILADLSEREDVAPGFREQWAQILDFLGVKSREEIKTEHHEKWAEAFEAYLMEGRPPSTRTEIVRAFEAFRLWLIRVYRAIQGIGAPVSKEVRDVFDRLIATDEEIENARQQSSYSVETLVDGPESIADEKERALWTARVNVQARILKERQREQEAWWKEEEKRLRAEAEREYRSIPARRAWDFLHGRVFDADGNPIDLDAGETFLNRDAVRAVLGDEKAAKNRIPMRRDGVDPGEIAPMFGFASGEDLVKAIVEVPGTKEWVDQRVQEMMQERYPDLLAERDRLRDEIHALLFAKSRIGWAIREWEELAKKARRHGARRNLNLEAIERAADLLLQTKKVREIAPGTILERERQAAERAARLAIEGNYEGALEEKEKQILNMILYRRSKELREEVNAARRYVLKKRRPEYRGDMAKAFEDYAIVWDAIRAIVGRRQDEPLDIDLQAAREAFESAVLKAMADEAAFEFDVQAIREMLARTDDKRWADLTVDEALNVRDALFQIRKNAMALLKLNLEGEERSLQELEAMVEREASELPDLGKAPASRQQVGLTRSAFDVMVGIHGDLIDPEQTFRSLGPTFEKIVWRRYLAAKGKKYELIARVLDPLFARWRALPKETLRDRFKVIEGLDKELPFPEEINLEGPRDRMWLLMVALNMGNESNRERLLRPFGWTAAQVLRVLNKHLSEAEWQWVQSIWDLFDKELWPEIEAKEKRVHGFAPKKIEPTEIVTPYGKLRGGYFPARYDSRASLDDVADRQEAGERSIFGPSYRRAATRKSHTKERAESYANVVNLDWGVFPSHVAQVIHDVAFDEYVRATWRFLRRPKIRNVLYRRLGARRWREPEEWLRAVANIQAVSGAHLSNNLARLLNIFRDRMIVGAIGWSATVAMADFANPLMAMAASKEAGGTSIRWGIPAYLAAIPFSPSYIPMRRFALSKSAELRNRRSGWTQQRREQFLRELGRKRGRLSRALVAVSNTVWFFMEQTDKMASTQIWLARYWEEKSQGKTDAEASRIADESVRRMLPGPERAEMPRLFRDPGALGGLMAFQGFFNKVYNIVAAEAGQVVRAGTRASRTGRAAEWGRFGLRTAQAAGSILGILFFVNVVGELLAGRGPEEDEEWEDWLAAKMAAAPFLLIPIVGADVSNIVESTLRERYVHPPSRAPSVSFAYDMGKRIWKAVSEDEEDSERVWALVEVALGAARLPINQPRRTLRFIEAVVNDEAWAETPLEIMSGLVYGERDAQALNPFTLTQQIIDEAEIFEGLESGGVEVALESAPMIGAEE